jgi:VWFA-related protein
MNKEELTMSLKSTCVSLLLIITAIYTYGQGQPVSPRLTGQEGAVGAQVILNEVNTDQYPQVHIFATVLKDGAPLKGLGASDFRVREDEVDQEPITVEPKLPPLSVVITLDTSGSMAKRMKETQAAAKSFLDTLGSNDSAQVVSFAREVKRLTTMSTNRQAAREAIGSTVARGDTALYDALYESIQLVKDRTGRKAIVLLSDGVDDDGTGKPLSKRTVQEVVSLARTVNVPIYVLGLGTEIGEAVLTEVGKETGALYFNAPQARDLTALYTKIGEQLAGQYAISYTSNLPADGTEHKVALTAQRVTDTKTYKAPGNAGAQEMKGPTEEVKPTPVYPFEAANYWHHEFEMIRNATDPQECAKRCDANPRCRVASFHGPRAGRNANSCALRSAIGERHPEDVDISSWVKPEKAPGNAGAQEKKSRTEEVKPTPVYPFEAANYWHHEFEIIRNATDPQECAKRCDANPRCRVATFCGPRAIGGCANSCVLRSAVGERHTEGTEAVDISSWLKP